MIKESIGKIGDLGCAIELPEETPSFDNLQKKEEINAKKEEETKKYEDIQGDIKDIEDNPFDMVGNEFDDEQLFG